MDMNNKDAAIIHSSQSLSCFFFPRSSEDAEIKWYKNKNQHNSESNRDTNTFTFQVDTLIQTFNESGTTMILNRPFVKMNITQKKGDLSKGKREYEVFFVLTT